MFNKYQNFISLGYFCNVAQDLEELGLRSTSSPFDWCITDFKGIIKAIDNGFIGFMDYNNLEQSELFRNHYRDSEYNCFFFHDFSKYKSLDKQYDLVKNKYKRRIDRFLSNIQNPTLFFRYISSERTDENGKSLELEFIETHLDIINSTIKKYNQENEIIYIGDPTVQSNIIKVYHVAIEENDVVSRHPIINNPELYPIIKKITIPGQKDNIQRFRLKQKHKNSIHIKIYQKTIQYFKKLFLKPIIYTKTYVIPNK